MVYQKFLVWVLKRAESVYHLNRAYVATVDGWLRVGHIEGTDVEIRAIHLVFTVLSHNGCPSFSMIGTREITSKQAAFKELCQMAKAGYKLRRWRFGLSDLVLPPDLKRLLASMEVQVTE